MDAIETLPPPLVEQLIIDAGAVGATFRHGEGRVFWLGASGKPIATALIEPLYTWHPSRIEWTTARRELVRDWPVPERGRADDLAHGMAREIGALGSCREAPLEEDRVPYHAMVGGWELRPSQSGPALDRASKASSLDVLAMLTVRLTEASTQYRAESAAVMRQDLLDHAAFFRAEARWLLAGRPLAASFEAIAAELASRAPRVLKDRAGAEAVIAELVMAFAAWKKMPTP